GDGGSLDHHTPLTTNACAATGPPASLVGMNARRGPLDERRWMSRTDRSIRSRSALIPTAKDATPCTKSAPGQAVSPAHGGWEGRPGVASSYDPTAMEGVVRSISTTPKALPGRRLPVALEIAPTVSARLAPTARDPPIRSPVSLWGEARPQIPWAASPLIQ